MKKNAALTQASTPAALQRLINENVVEDTTAEGRSKRRNAEAAVVYAKETMNGVDKLKKFGWSEAVDQPGEFAMIPKGQLNIDREHYQRDPRNVDTITSIAKEWSWVACGCITVALRDDGSYWVMDGQNRTLAALRRSDIKELPCMIYLMPGGAEAVVEEAKGFVRLNTQRRPLNGIEKFKAQVTSGDPNAQVVNRLLTKYGYGVSRGSAEKRNVRCIQELFRAAEETPEALDRALSIYHECFDAASIRGNVLRGLLELERRGAIDLNDKKFRSRLHKLGHEEVVRGIAKAMEFHGTAGVRIYAEGIEKVVNKGLRNDLVDRLKVMPA